MFAALIATTHARHRDAFGRTTDDHTDDHTDDLPRAWLAAALHLREFTTATAQRLWLSASHTEGALGRLG